jgi:hypothetical protein
VWEGISGRGRMKEGNMVDGFHTPIWNRTKKPLAIALSGAGMGLKGRGDGGDVTNVQYKSNWNCHCESLPV